MNNSHYKINVYKNRRYITFPILEEYNLAHCLTTMDSFKTGSPMDLKYKEDFIELTEFINSKNKAWFFSDQVHGDNIEIITQNNLGLEKELGKVFSNSDGLIGQDISGILFTKYADCTPVIVFDKKKRIVATIHSGWKGTVLKISRKAIKILVEDLKCNFEDLIIVLGPSIGYLDFEVKSDVYDEFISSFGENLMEKNSTPKGSEQYLIDIPSLIKADLLSMGILEENFYTSDLSTFSNEYLHSFRRDKNHSGRMVLACSI